LLVSKFKFKQLKYRKQQILTEKRNLDKSITDTKGKELESHLLDHQREYMKASAEIWKSLATAEEKEEYLALEHDFLTYTIDRVNFDTKYNSTYNTTLDILIHTLDTICKKQASASISLDPLIDTEIYTHDTSTSSSSSSSSPSSYLFNIFK